jgi:hypothetical protein
MRPVRNQRKKRNAQPSLPCHTHPATATKQQQLQDGCGSGRGVAEQWSSRAGVVGVGGWWWIFVCTPTRMLIKNWQLFDMLPTRPRHTMVFNLGYVQTNNRRRQ